MNTERTCSHKGFWLAIVLMSLVLLMSVAANMGLFLGLILSWGATPLRDQAVDEYPRLVEHWSYGRGTAKAARIALDGVIMREADGGFFAARYDKIETVLRQVRAAQHDAGVRAIILEVSSPGGAITPSDEIYQALMDFKETDEDRRVVVHMKDLAASGAYYVAMAADWLMAEPTSVVGSIGVIIQALNWKELSEKVGLKATTIKSGENKDLLNPFQETPPEQVALLQEMIDSMYARFVGLVQEARGLDDAELEILADGRILTAESALENNLIDEIGYWDDVVARTTELLGEESIKVVRYEQTPDLFEWLSGVRLFPRMGSLHGAGVPRMLYLWSP